MNIQVEMDGNLWKRVCMFACLLGATSACAMDAGKGADGEGDRRDVAVAKQSIINGNDITDAETLTFAGIVSIHIRQTNEVCTGTLMTNNRVVTARHCIEPFPKSTLVVNMGLQRADVSRAYNHPEEDISVLHLDRRFTMRDSNGNLSTDGYQRELDSRTPYEIWLSGTPVICFGFGANRIENGEEKGAGFFPLRWGIMGIDYNWVPRQIGTLRDRQAFLDYDYGYSLSGGDSGGPCLNWFTPASSQLVTSNFADSSGRWGNAVNVLHPEIRYWMALAMR